MATPKKPTIRETVSLYEAKTHLSELVEKASAGQEIIISKSGKPKAMIVPLPPHPERRSGMGRGMWDMSIDYEAPMSEEELALYYEDNLLPKDDE